MMAVQLPDALPRLGELLADLPVDGVPPDVRISGLSLDSRTLESGALFLACPGASGHGLDFAGQALARGVAAIACAPGGRWSRERIATVSRSFECPLVIVDDLAAHASLIAGRFYRHPSRTLHLVGFTGTNGKTSCSLFLARAMAAAHQRCGVIGTLGSGFPGDLRTTTHTTPDAVDVQARLAQLGGFGATMVAMEVSSHALDQGRVSAVRFDTAVLTNLSRDHLDYHVDMAAYAEAKQRLFRQPELRCAVLNFDDPFGRQLAEAVPTSVHPVLYASESPPEVMAAASAAWVSATRVEADPSGLRLEIKSSWGDGQLESRLLGRFNASNLMAVLAVLLEGGMPVSEALECLSGLSAVPGRMEVFGGPGQPTVVVDYAHTPDALEQTIRSLREHCRGHLICVFGCGGDRDRGKRRLMGAVAQAGSDSVILTDDNPRTENGDRIVADIMRGMRDRDTVNVERNRARAIEQAVSRARVGDLVLVAGKGHETTQQIGDLTLPFSDRAHVARLLAGGASE
jgi:UDP-N-acetylmuramoyl-L-alanyl-D-glutamate--2,6-diaminopimelate ligase